MNRWASVEKEYLVLLGSWRKMRTSLPRKEPTKSELRHFDSEARGLVRFALLRRSAFLWRSLTEGGAEDNRAGDRNSRLERDRDAEKNWLGVRSFFAGMFRFRTAAPGWDQPASQVHGCGGTHESV